MTLKLLPDGPQGTPVFSSKEAYNAWREQFAVTIAPKLKTLERARALSELESQTRIVGTSSGTVGIGISNQGTLMNEHDTVALMKSSKSEAEWNSNCSKVKKANDGHYPSFWFEAIIASGVAAQTLESFGASASISVTLNP